MRAVILDGSSNQDPMGRRVGAKMSQRLVEAGYEVESITLRDAKIGPCAGDFFCWLKNPGVCNTADDNREIVAKLVNSQLAVYLTPLTFGGYSSQLKRLVDHQIQNVLPYFEKAHNETHHQKRYESYPDLLVLGWQDQADPQAKFVFRQLAHRNAFNFYAERFGCVVLPSSLSDDELQAHSAGWVSALQPTPDLIDLEGQPVQAAAGTSIAQAPRKALLLVGSPRTRKSSSAALGEHLLGKLRAEGIETETIYIYTSINSAEKTSVLLNKANETDLILLAFPLYVDSLPAPVIDLLEKLALQRATQPDGRQAQFAAIVNCGFPEARHNNIAIAICEQFARQAGYSWAGGLSIGGGHGLVGGQALGKGSAPINGIIRSVENAAAALAKGQKIDPAQSSPNLPIPAWLYRFLGTMGWNRHADEYGVRKLIRRKSYLKNPEKEN